jgi:hypothetical protein
VELIVMNSSWFAAAGAAAILAAIPGYACAEDAPAQAVPSLSSILEGSGISASGYIAASYAHSSGYPINVHEFDVNHDSFQLDQAGLTVAYQPKSGFGALVNVIAGEDARILHKAEDSHDEAFDLLQAYVQYATGPLTVIAGKFVTLAGAEVIAPTGNTNFSRSLLFSYAEPLTHTGVRASYALSDSFTLIGGVNDGWNTTSTSCGSKTGEAGIAWTPSKLFSVAAQGYLGKMLPYDAQRTLVDVVATFNATAALTLIANIDFDEQESALAGGGTARWAGIAAYANYAFNTQWRVSLRGEYLDDRDGFLTGSQQHLWEGTTTVGFAPVKSFELRMEARYDKAQVDSFYKTSAALAAATPDVDNLTGVAIQGVYKF